MLHHSKGEQYIEKQSKDIHLLTMSRANKVYVPLMGTTRKLQIALRASLMQATPYKSQKPSLRA
jgi:hypothetical protein